MINSEQVEVVQLTVKLKSKIKEYKILCNKLEQIRKSNINPNDKRLLKLKELFQKNHDEIVEINNRLRKIKQ